jgi:hypothetical protein
VAKKGLLVLIIAVLAAGGAFAQNDFSSMAKNTITVDVGPTILGFGVGMAPNIIGVIGMDIGDLVISPPKGFGIAGQYERQLLPILSVAGRFSYMMADLGVSQTERDTSIKYYLSLKSFSVEGHVRFYPLGDTFFLGGMVGYANLNTDFSVKVNERGTVTDILAAPANGNYIKLGAMVGWRISFGKNGGFTFEPSVGYSFVPPLGTPIGKQIEDQYEDVDLSFYADMFSYVEQFGVGGPRVSLSFGYRF